MFHQVRVLPSDRDALRFLWRFTENLPVDTYHINVDLFGKTDSPSCSNWALRKTALDSCKKFNVHAANAVLNKFYMNNYLDSFDNLEEAITRLLTFSGLNLAKFISNNRIILKNLSRESLSSSVANLDLEELATDRALGITWDSNTDMLKFNVSKKVVPETKKGILSAISSIFNPMGLIAPVIVKIKLLIQELWKRGLDWDTKIPDDLLRQWDIWKQNVAKLSSLSIPRWINFSSNSEVVELYIFAEASSVAYGTAAYIKLVYQNSTSCSLIIRKSKLAPVKNKLVTIPRLELQAALMASRIEVKILDQMDMAIGSVLLWSDLKTVLNYLRNTKTNFGPYIMRRCNEIRVNTRVDDWRYIPSEINIADVLSRGVSFDKFHLSTWFTGPEFLVSNNQNYDFEGLKDKTACDEVRIETAEDHKGNNVNVSVSNVSTKSVSPPPIFWEYYSSNDMSHG